MYLKCVEGDIRFNTDDIILIESDKHRNLIIMRNNSIFHIYCKLDDLELILSEYGFIGVHKSYLVNLRHMIRLCNYKLTLDNNMTIRVPRGRYRYVKSKFCCNDIDDNR